MTHTVGPWRLKEMRPDAVRDRLRRRATLLVPVGTTAQHGPGLPYGCDTIIVEHVADELSARYGVVRAPTVEFGVGAASRPRPGGAVLRRRTLHRVMNELIESWEEEAGVNDFVVLTAQGEDAHLEALSTIRTDSAIVQVMDIFSIDFGDLLHHTQVPARTQELQASLLSHLAPGLIGPEIASGETFPASRLVTAQKGAQLYKFIVDRISTCLDRA